MKDLPNPQNIKALALDLDGTLLGNNANLTERSIKAIKKCREMGIRIIISTGRVIEAAEHFPKALNAEGPMIFLNGSIIADMDGEGIIKTTFMDKRAAEYCVDLALEHGIYCQMFVQSDPATTEEKPKISLLAIKDCPERMYYHGKTGILSEISDIKKLLFNPDFDRVIKTMFICEPEVQSLICPGLFKNIGDKAYIVQTYRTYIEILNKNISKGRALSHIMDEFSILPGEIIAFGDEENDIPMFEVAGYSVVPSSAKESIKARADFIIGANDDDGVAAFLEDLFSF